MIRRLLLTLWALLLAVPALAAPDTGRFVETDVPSRAFGPIHTVTWLPPGYDRDRNRHYPVVYMHDAQNLFFPKRSNFNKVWAADKAALGLIAAHKVAPFIIVGIDHPGPRRYQRYFPDKVADPVFARGIAAKVGPLQGDGYVAFLADELKPLIDRTYRTRPQAKYTATTGSSMGGLISIYLLGERPDVFGKAAAVSTHIPLVDPDTIKARPELADIVKRDWAAWLTTRMGAPRGRKLWMDHGTETLDSNYAPYQTAVDADLRQLGWTDAEFRSRVFQGAAHEENAWAARLPEMWGWLLADWKK